MGKIARSWALTKESWAVLRTDKSLMLFPLLSSGATLLILATFAVPVLILLSRSGGIEHADRMNRVTSSVLGFAFYFCTFTVMNFFNVALIGAALERFAGRESNLKIGLAIAMKRLPQILMWSAFAATVGMILRAIEERLGIIGRVVIWLVGTAWAIAIFFVVPVLAAEGVGPIDAVKRSVSVLKKTWGEAALTRIGVSTVFTLIMLPIILIGAIAAVGVSVATNSYIPAVIIGAIFVLFIIGLTLVSTTLDAILQAALYRYATEGAAPAGFQPETLTNIFQPKKKKTE